MTSTGSVSGRVNRRQRCSGAATPLAADPRHDVKYVAVDPATREVIAAAILRDRLEPFLR